MARIRSVKPDLFSSYSLAPLPIEARYLFIALFTEADDEGRMIDSPKRIAGTVFPHDDKITERHVQQWLELLARAGCICRYVSGDGRYIHLPKWEDHQRISHATPSRLPRHSGCSPESLPPDLGTGNREQGGGGEETPPASPPPPLEPPPTGTMPEAFREWAKANGYGHLDLDRQWSRMLARARERAKRSADWEASWQMWLANEEPVFAKGHAAPAYCGKCANGWLERRDGSVDPCECRSAAAS